MAAQTPVADTLTEKTDYSDAFEVEMEQSEQPGEQPKSDQVNMADDEQVDPFQAEIKVDECVCLCSLCAQEGSSLEPPGCLRCLCCLCQPCTNSSLSCAFCCCCYVEKRRIPELIFVTLVCMMTLMNYAYGGQIWLNFINSIARNMLAGFTICLIVFGYLPLYGIAQLLGIVLNAGDAEKKDQQTLVKLLWCFINYFGPCYYRRVVNGVLFGAVFFILLPLMLIARETERLNDGAIRTAFGVNHPRSPASVSFDFGDWMFKSDIWGDFVFTIRNQWEMVTDFEKESLVYKTVAQRTPGCVRDWTPTLEIDLYHPHNTSGALAPILVHIHGGSWMSFDRSTAALSYTYWLERGFAVASPQYSFVCDGFNVADMRLELIEALQHIRVNAGGWGWDKDRIFISGDSSGGHLAMMVAYTVNASSLGIRGVVNNYGPSYFESWACDVDNLVNGSCTDANLRAASPLYEVTTNSPPTLTFLGSGDTLVPWSQGSRLHEALDAAAVPNYLLRAESYEHIPELGYYGAPAQMQRYAMERFLTTTSLNA